MFLVEHQHPYLWFWADNNTNFSYNSGRPIYTQGATNTSFANFSVGVIADDNKLMLELDAPYILTTDFDLEQWNHVVVTYQGSNDNTGGEVKPILMARWFQQLKYKVRQLQVTPMGLI